MLESGEKAVKKSHKIRNVIIIVALLALLTITGFVLYTEFSFGLSSGGLPATANVLISTVTCGGSTSLVCNAELQNTGAASTEAISAAITFGGGTEAGTCNQAVVYAGETSSFQCNFQTASGSPGSPFTYRVSLSDGIAVMFDGDFTG